MNLFRKTSQILVMMIASVAAISALAQTPAAKEPRVVLKGYDPVAYFTDGKPTRGVPDINYDWDEGRYQFSNAKNKQAFSTTPDRFAPQFAGFCTAGIAKGMKAEANPEIFMVVDGKLYTFSSQKAREMAAADPTLFARAAKSWAEKK